MKPITASEIRAFNLEALHNNTLEARRFGTLDYAAAIQEADRARLSERRDE